MVDDLIMLEHEGVEAGHARTRLVIAQVKFDGQKVRMYVRYMGDKGDWPWLRHAHKLQTGFSSRRICHLCDLDDA